MQEKTKSIIITSIGIFFLVYSVISISASIIQKNPVQALYFCYIGLTLCGIGILIRNSMIVISQIYLLLIPQGIWIIDFLFHIFTGTPLWGVTNYFFLEDASALGRIISLQHFFMIPLAIYASVLIEIKKKWAWLLSFLEMTIVYFIVKSVGTPEYNVNCVFKPCLDVSLGLPYPLTWFISVAVIIFLTAIVLNLNEKTRGENGN